MSPIDVSRLVRTQISVSELAPPQELVQGVNDGQVALLEVVKALGEYLTSTEDGVRLKGLTFLTSLLAAINSSKINRQATSTLTSFYTSKLDDFDSLPPALQGLTTLSKLPHFDDTAAVEVYQAIVENVNMKSYAQATRHLVYVLFDSLLASHRNALKSMGTAFLNSYTKMVDGEKDPRNLMLLFSIDRVILLEFDVRDHIEDFFDITFCYFPITFKQPPNDPYGITADDLKFALRSCMAASPYFAKMALPLFLEKFATATGQSMKDLQLSMAACLPVYGAEAVKERGSELWEGIKTEILYSSDTTIEEAALSALEALMRTLYPTNDDTPTGLAQEIIKQSLELLEEPEKSQAISATKILAAMLRASPSAGKYALSQAFPQLFRQFNQPKAPSHRPPLLSTISSLLVAARSIYSVPSSKRQYHEEKSLDPYRDNLSDVLREGLRTEGLKASAIQGSVALVEIPGFWGRGEVEDIVRGIDDILINDEDPDIKPEVIKGLTSVSKIHPTSIESITLPLLFHSLPDRAPALSDIDGREKYRSILGSLSELCVEPGLFETLIIRISNKLDLLTSPAPVATTSTAQTDEHGDITMDNQTESRECEVAFAYDLLNCLAKVIEKKVTSNHVDVVKYFDTLVPKLFGLIVDAALPKIGDREPLFKDRRLGSIVARIGGMMVWELPAERQSKHLAAIYAAFEQGKLGGIVDPSKIASSSSSSSPLRTAASSSEQDLISLYSSTVQSLKPDVSLPFSSPAEFLSSKIHWTINVAHDRYQVRWALDLITAFVNKREAELRNSLEMILDRIWEVDIQDTSKELERRKHGLLVYLHIIKALALLRQNLAYTSIAHVVEILSLSNLDPEFVDAAARGFEVLTKGKEKGSHLTTKLLYAQKLWNVVLPQLIQGNKDAQGKGRLVYLVAFASLLPLVPASICLSDLQTILPLIQRSLSLPDPAQRTNAITTLASILETANESKEIDSVIHKQAEVLLDALLRSAVVDPDVPSSGKVRTSALVALSAFPDVVRFETLHNAKSRVLRELGKALDDPLRAVRKEAVECRAKWYRYGGSK